MSLLVSSVEELLLHWTQNSFRCCPTLNKQSARMCYRGEVKHKYNTDARKFRTPGKGLSMCLRWLCSYQMWYACSPSAIRLYNTYHISAWLDLDLILTSNASVWLELQFASNYRLWLFFPPLRLCGLKGLSRIKWRKMDDLAFSSRCAAGERCVSI